MAQSTHQDGLSEPSDWGRLTQALLGGMAVAGAGFTHIAVVQTPGLEPPPETAALFLVSTTAAVVSYLLVRMRLYLLGYAGAVVAGGVVLGSIGLVIGGRYGPSGPQTNPVGPIVWVVLSVATILAALVAWRGREPSESSTFR